MANLLDQLPADVSILVRGAANLEADVFDDETEVLAVALRHFFDEHADLKHAAVADRYAASRMSTGRAANLAGVAPGGEIERLLRDHGVEPRTGPAADSETRREEARNARELFRTGANDAPASTPEDDTET